MKWRPAGSVLWRRLASLSKPYITKSSYLVNTLVIKLLAVGNVLPAHGMVHVGLDAAGRDRIDGNFLVAEI